MMAIKKEGLTVGLYLQKVVIKIYALMLRSNR
jgi:hypothetical protein